MISDGITFIMGGFHNPAYLMLRTIQYLMVIEDVYHKLIEEMKERVGSDQGDKLKSYVCDQNT